MFDHVSGSDDQGTVEAFTDEERRLLHANIARIEEHGPYDRSDPTFCVPHQQEIGRMVEFNRLTVTIDDIVEQCGYPESERARLTWQHRRTAQEYLKHYQGSIIGPVPLLETQSASAE